jgi:hypothetical protein
MDNTDIVESIESGKVRDLPQSTPRDKTGDKDSLQFEHSRVLGRPPDTRPRDADFAARDTVRSQTRPSSCFAKSQRAPYEAPEGWRSWEEFTRYSEDVPT